VKSCYDHLFRLPTSPGEVVNCSFRNAIAQLGGVHVVFANKSSVPEHGVGSCFHVGLEVLVQGEVGSSRLIVVYIDDILRAFTRGESRIEQVLPTTAAAAGSFVRV
jgi:hypothetical protein